MCEEGENVSSRHKETVAAALVIYLCKNVLKSMMALIPYSVRVCNLLRQLTAMLELWKQFISLYKFLTYLSSTISLAGSGFISVGT